MKTDISYFEDIIDDISKQYPDFTKEELSEIAWLNIQYIKEKTKGKDVTNIKIPGISNLYFNVSLANKLKPNIEKFNNKKNFDIILNKYNKVEKVSEEHIIKHRPYLRHHSLHFKKPFVINMFSYYFNKGTVLLTIKNVWEKVSKNQNKINSK